MKTRLILLGLLSGLSLVFLLVQISGVLSSDLRRQRVPERDFSSRNSQGGERLGSIRRNSEERSRESSASDLLQRAIISEGSRSQVGQAPRSNPGSAGSVDAKSVDSLPYRLPSNENDRGGIPSSVAGVQSLGAVPRVAVPPNITPRSVPYAMVSPAVIPTPHSPEGYLSQGKSGSVETGGVSSGDQFVVNGATVSITSSAPIGLDENGPETLELVLSPASAGGSMASMSAPSTAPVVRSRLRSGFTREEELFRAKWGWEAYDQALKFAAEAGQ
jgi:hypothetical protein